MPPFTYVYKNLTYKQLIFYLYILSAGEPIRAVEIAEGLQYKRIEPGTVEGFYRSLKKKGYLTKISINNLIHIKPIFDEK